MRFFTVALWYFTISFTCKTESFPLISSRCAAFLRFLTSRRIETCLSPKCTRSADKCEFGLVLSCWIVDAFVTLLDANPLIRRELQRLASFLLAFSLQGVEQNSLFLGYKWSISLSCCFSFQFSLECICNKHLVDFFWLMLMGKMFHNKEQEHIYQSSTDNLMVSVMQLVCITPHSSLRPGLWFVERCICAAIMFPSFFLLVLWICRCWAGYHEIFCSAGRS